MRKLKKVTAFALSTIMAMSMIGCGNKKSDNSATNTDATGTDVVSDEWATTEEDAPDGEPCLKNPGDVLFEMNYDDGKDPFVNYTNGGEFERKIEDGKMALAVNKTGSVEHGCQVYYDGFALLQGCEYTITFDISADTERMLEWRLQINSGDYHAYASDRLNIGPEVMSVTQDFYMEESTDPAPRFCFNFGGFEENGDMGTHKIFVDNIKLVVKDGSNALEVEPLPVPKKVRVNQIGYAPNDKKFVAVGSEEDEQFKIVDVATGETVYVGTYGPALYDEPIGARSKCGDFSDFTTPGRYKIISAPSGESYEFEIGDNLYDDIYRDVVLMLYKQRCGLELDAGIAGSFAHPACHTQIAKVYGDASKQYDVSGGWHDAGDYGRYVVSGAKTVQDLFLAYEDFGADYDDIGIPESGNGVPDLLDEARYELDWMLKMQEPSNGGVYHKVSGLMFPETVLPQDETDDMILAPISYAATADFAAVMAKASALYKDIDADFADKCLNAAVLAYGYLEENPNAKSYVNPDDLVTGEYPDNNLKDELLWASSELYIVTGDDRYKAAIDDAFTRKLPTGLGWAAIGTFATYDLANAEGIDSAISEGAKASIITAADDMLETCAKTVLGIDQLTSFEWGSNMRVANSGMLMLMAYNLTGDEKYMTSAMRQRDYIFGVNGVSYCFVTGYGDVYPDDTHHRPSQVLGETMPGMLVGGANSGLQDPYALAVLAKVAPGRAYVDNEQSFSCNEICVYWNSPLIYLMTGLQ